MFRVVEPVFKRWTNGNQSLNSFIGGSLLMLFLPHSMTTFLWKTSWWKSYISNTPQNMLYAIPTDAKIDKSFTKKIFPYVIITCGTCYNRVSYYFAINIVMVNVETVIIVNFKPVIIVNSFRRYWIHEKSLGGLL